MIPFGAMEIIENPFVGKLVMPEWPDSLKRPRGPYQRRRLKRWLRRNPARYEATGNYYVIDRGRHVICHPDDARYLRDRLLFPRLDLPGKSQLGNS